AIRVDESNVPYSMASGAYVVPFNLTGYPVVVIPVGQTQSGLPLGVQVIGKRWRDMELLAIAGHSAYSRSPSILPTIDTANRYASC
ncbi:MAG: amidase family protein, partial [Pleurocapsa sp.]